MPVGTTFKYQQLCIANEEYGTAAKAIKYVLKYPPRTHAFLGALLEKLKTGKDIGELKQSLNPLTVYALGIDKRTLTTAPQWNIK